MDRVAGMNPGRKPEQSRASTHRRAAATPEPLERILELQRTAGNAAVQARFSETRSIRRSSGARAVQLSPMD
jgi:hypothetical protein